MGMKKTAITCFKNNWCDHRATEKTNKETNKQTALKGSVEFVKKQRLTLSSRVFSSYKVITSVNVIRIQPEKVSHLLKPF